MSGWKEWLSYRNQNGYTCTMKTGASRKGTARGTTTKARAPGASRDMAAAEPARPARTRARPRRAALRSGAPLAPWTAAEQALFLEAIASTGRVERAVEASGRTRASAFAERLRDPDFALAWDEALGCELEVLETRLIARALDGASPAAARTPMSADLRAADRLALQILAHCRPPAKAGAVGPPRAARGTATPPRVEAPVGKDVALPPDDPAALAAAIDALLDGVAQRIGAAEARAADPA